MGAHVLADGKGKKIGITSICEDLTYAQAEVLFFAEKLKAESITPFIVAFPTAHAAMTVERFLEAYKQTPKDLERLEEIREKIKSKGFQSLIVRDYVDDFETFAKSKPELQIGRSMDGLVDELTRFKVSGDDRNIEDLLESAQSNPLHAGVHIDFKATVSDEMWISDAAKMIRKHTPERWCRRLLDTLRFYFKGQPKIPLPNRNDRCPCQSGWKYGKCCGSGVEIEDPEDCKLGRHVFTSWRRVEDKYVRSCERCYRVYDAPWFEDAEIDGVEVLIIGCRACGSKPTTDDMRRELAKANIWNSCGSCGKSLGVSSMLLEHQFNDGKHLQNWMMTEVLAREEAVDVTSAGLGKMAFMHKECFMKAVPKWPKVARPIAAKDEVSMELPGQAKEYTVNITMP